MLFSIRWQKAAFSQDGGLRRQSPGWYRGWGKSQKEGSHREDEAPDQCTNPAQFQDTDTQVCTPTQGNPQSLAKKLKREAEKLPRDFAARRGENSLALSSAQSTAHRNRIHYFSEKHNGIQVSTTMLNMQKKKLLDIQCKKENMTHGEESHG